MQTCAMVILAALAAGTLLPAAAKAMTASRQPLAAIARSTAVPIDRIGCYRMGLSGYHWYHYCAGPRFLYPHHRICHHHYCYYR